MRLHLGHHFYGAGNLGDDFMLAGFLAALRTVTPSATFTCCIPFELAPARTRFPEIEWRPYTDAARADAIAGCEAWLGLGGSPFQHTQSRWFVDHLNSEAALCARARKPMFFLGIGVQTASELLDREVQTVVRAASTIWTRDTPSADRLATVLPANRVYASTDLSHTFFRDTSPPPAKTGRVTLVANFDYGAWPGQSACLAAATALGAAQHIWLAQESRELPGAEHALHRALPAEERERWALTSPDSPGTPLSAVLAAWPSGEWLVTSRFHAAIAGAWAGSKIVVIGTNEKLRGVAHELQLPLIAPDADEATVAQALASARSVPRSVLEACAARAERACADFALQMPR